jgi:hypothetical protein
MALMAKANPVTVIKTDMILSHSVAIHMGDMDKTYSNPSNVAVSRDLTISVVPYKVILLSGSIEFVVAVNLHAILCPA